MTILRNTLAAAAALGLALGASAVLADTTLLNVSYDPTRELYKDVNAAFVKDWKAKGGDNVTIEQSHGGSGKQARAVIDGLQADVVTLALQGDIDQIAKAGLIGADWQKRLANNSSPYTSTIVFLVRKGNPKNIKDWDDLVKQGVEVITPNPKTSGGARWNYLAAWAFADGKFGHDEAKNQEFVRKLYANVPVLDTGARGSTTTFAQRGIGDVLLAWENEAFLASTSSAPTSSRSSCRRSRSRRSRRSPSSTRSSTPRARAKSPRPISKFLYTPEAQKLIAKRYYRPSDPSAADPKDLARFADVKLVSIDDPLFGGWAKAQPKHFDDGGIFDQIYQPKSTN